MSATSKCKLFPEGSELPPWRSRKERILDAVFDPAAIVRLPHLLQRAADVEAARSLLSDALDRYAAFRSPMQAFRFYETGPRDVALGLGLLPNEEILCPLEDDDFVAFALGLPWHVSVDDELRDEVLLAAYPAFADIPFEVDIVLPPGSR